MNIEQFASGFQVKMDDKVIFRHSAKEPMVFIGQGEPIIDMYRGNFQVQDDLYSRIPLTAWEIVDDTNIRFLTADGQEDYTLSFVDTGDEVVIKGSFSGKANRLWIRLPATKDDAVYGGGEQYSYFNLRGKSFQIMTNEQGMGRNKSTYFTFLADQEKGGGDYDWTNFAQPTFLSTQGYFFHMDNYYFCRLNFTHETYHEVEIWGTEIQLTLATAKTMKELVQKVSNHVGRQPKLPDWAFQGVQLGIQGGADVVQQKIDTMEGAHAHVTGVWCQDWAGVRYTSFGKRLMWNWMVNDALYPDLKEKIKAWNQKGIQYLAYVNPYVAEGKSQYEEASAKGYLALDQEGQNYLVDFGEFDCGVVDFTNPAAYDWYKNEIKTNMVELGITGWMADFGEYLPMDCVLYNKEDGMHAHNRWPVMWSKLNREVMEETDTLGKMCIYFRSGAAGSQGNAPLFWAGDQNVDFSLDDGLASVVVAALSAGMSGVGVHTHDSAGYTSLFDVVRTKELMLRGAEFSMLTPVFRTHEGNRPDTSWQFDHDQETVDHVAWASRIHTALFPYTKAVSEEYYETGIPMMRSLLLEYPEEAATYDLKYQYLLGADLLVAPVYTEGAETVEVYIPNGQWISLWDDTVLDGQATYTVEAPIGKPAAYYRKGSAFAELFQSLKTIKRK